MRSYVRDFLSFPSLSLSPNSSLKRRSFDPSILQRRRDDFYGGKNWTWRDSSRSLIPSWAQFYHFFPRLIGGSPVFLSILSEYPFPSNGDLCCFSFTLFLILFFAPSVGEKILLMEAQKRGIFLFSTKIDRPARKKRKKRRMRKETSEPSCSRRRCHATALSRLTYLSRWRFQIVTRRNFSRDENGRGYKIRKFRQTFSNMCMITGMENTIPR